MRTWLSTQLARTHVGTRRVVSPLGTSNHVAYMTEPGGIARERILGEWRWESPLLSIHWQCAKVTSRRTRDRWGFGDMLSQSTHGPCRTSRTLSAGRWSNFWENGVEGVWHHCSVRPRHVEARSKFWLHIFCSCSRRYRHRVSSSDDSNPSFSVASFPSI